LRHTYFNGADEPYDKLRHALRAEVDEAAWSSLYSTRSRAFDRSKIGKIAVKVINQRATSPFVSLIQTLGAAPRTRAD
jgi:adenine-specific DNA-methyltransferase